MGGRHLHADSRLPFRDHRITEPHDIDAFCQQPVGHRGGQGSVAQHDGNNRMISVDQAKSKRGEPRAKERGILAQPGAQLLTLLDEGQRLQGAGGNRRRQRIGEQIRPRALAKEFHDVCASRRESSCRPAERLAQRARHDIDAIGDPKVGGSATPLCPDDSGGMAVVDHDGGLVVFCELDDPVELRQIAVHGEHTVRGDQAEAEVRASFSLLPSSFMSEWA